MRKPAVIVLEPESSGIDLISAATNLGLVVHVFDQRPINAVPDALRDAVQTYDAVFTQLDIQSVSEIVRAARNLADKTQLVAVLPGFEYAVSNAAIVARQLNLPGLDPATTEAVRNKEKMKQMLSAAGVRVAPAVSIDVSEASAENITHIAAQIGFPAVVKPVDGSGSLGVQRIDDRAGLLDYVAQLANVRLADMGRTVGTRIMFEKYVNGPEFSVEGYTTHHGTTIVSVTEKTLGPEPHFVELGHMVDADLDRGSRAALEQTTRLAVGALKFSLGVFHLEARLSPEGPVVIETAARLAGDRIPRLISIAHDYDLPRTMICCLAGLPVPAPPVAAAARRVAAVRFFTSEHVGSIAHPFGLRRQLADLPGVVELDLPVTASTILQPATDFRQRYGHLIIAASDHNRLKAVLNEVDRLLPTAIKELHDAYTDHQPAA